MLHCLSRVLLLIALLAQALLAQAQAPADLGPRIEALLAARVPAGGPGVAVLVARGDTLLWRGARGRASIELDVPLSPEQVFRIGSISKQFAAAALLQRVEQGRARLDDPLAKYLPDYPGAASITLAQLLNHTADVKNYTDLPGYMAEPIRRDLDTAALVKVFKDQAPDFAPGTAWSYSNSGYVLVGAVLEAIDRRPWYASVAAMLEPLGIRRTTWGDDRAVVPGMAAGYSTAPDGQVTRAALLSMTQPHAAGALLSTVDDLWRWNRALHGGRVLGPETYRRMTTPEGEAAGKARYGFGIATGTLRGEPLLQHGGGINGFLSMLCWLAQSQLTVVVLRNSDGPGLDTGALARQIAALALGKPYPDGPTLALAPAELSALAGRWRKQGAGDERVLRVADGVLTSQRDGGPVFKLRPVARGVFLFEGSLGRIESSVEAGTEAGATAATLRFFPDGEGEGELWQRVGEVPAARAEITLGDAQRQALLGEYSSPQFSYKVFVDAQGVLRGQAPGQPALQLFAQSPRQLYVKEVGASFEFEPAEGAAERMVLTQGRTRLLLPRKP
jgi:CubicO group peptidase (beta-lactamase class C family)